jgi:hypothetical protein
MHSWLQNALQQTKIADYTVVEETLVVATLISDVTFRFEGDLEFRRGPFSPQVFLTGQVIMTRDPVIMGLITYYEELCDKDVFQICKETTVALLARTLFHPNQESHDGFSESHHNS